MRYLMICLWVLACSTQEEKDTPTPVTFEGVILLHSPMKTPMAEVKSPITCPASVPRALFFVFAKTVVLENL